MGKSLLQYPDVQKTKEHQNWVTVTNKASLSFSITKRNLTKYFVDKLQLKTFIASIPRAKVTPNRDQIEEFYNVLLSQLVKKA